MMMAHVCNLELGDFIHTLGDAHIYTNHFKQTELQLSRETKALPRMKINPKVKSIFDFTIDDFELVDYEFHPHIKGKVAI
jgi:thymidylate synthase